MTTPPEPSVLCMHVQVAAWSAADLPAGAILEGVVVCVHPYGVGVYLPEAQDFGHVNVPELSESPLIALSDYPAVGSHLDLAVLGRSGRFGQLRLGTGQRH